MNTQQALQSIYKSLQQFTETSPCSKYLEDPLKIFEHGVDVGKYIYATQLQEELEKIIQEENNDE